HPASPQPGSAAAGVASRLAPRGRRCLNYCHESTCADGEDTPVAVGCAGLGVPVRRAGEVSQKARDDVPDTIDRAAVRWPAAGGRTGHGCCNPAPGFLGIIHTAAAAAITEEGTDADSAGVHALSVRSATELRRVRTLCLRVP